MDGKDKETFASIGRVEAIRRLFDGSGYAPFGEPLDFDSCGVGCVTASRMTLEGVDFNLEYFPLKHLGYKCVVAVTGELHARLVEPRTLSVVLGVSAKLDFDEIRQLWEGVVFAAREFGYGGLSLELMPSRNGLAISMSATGARKSARGRADVRSKDLIAVSGRLGAAYFGQQVLERKPSELEKYRMMVGEYLRPDLDPRVISRLFEAGITPVRGVFVTRGLSDAVLRLAGESGLGAKIYADHIPFEGGSFDLGRELDIDPVSAAMNGGDDMRLLYVIPIGDFEKFHREFPTYEIVGHMAQAEVGAVLVTPDGLEHPLAAQGW